MHEPTDRRPSDGDTKERLLAIALDMLAEGGAQSITMRKVAERAGISVSVVHHHYVNKRGLLDECKGSFYSGLATLGAQVLSELAGADTDAAIETCIRETWTYARGRMHVLRLLAGDVFAEGDVIEAYRGYENRPVFAAATAYFAPRLGLSEITTRARVQAIIVLVTRFAISSELELATIFGVAETDSTAEAERQLIEMAKALLRP